MAHRKLIRRIKSLSSKVSAQEMALAFIRALLLNTDGKGNSVHTDCPVCLWEDNYTLDNDVIKRKGE